MFTPTWIKPALVSMRRNRHTLDAAALAEHLRDAMRCSKSIRSGSRVVRTCRNHYLRHTWGEAAYGGKFMRRRRSWKQASCSCACRAVPFPLNRDRVYRFVEGRQQAHEVHLGLLAKDVECPGAVLARTPREQYATQHQADTQEAPLTAVEPMTRIGGRSPAGSGCVSRCSACARISRLSTKRGPGRLK